MAQTAPPGLDGVVTTAPAANGSSFTGAEAAIVAEVRRLVLVDVDSKVADKMKDMWSKGNKMMKQAELSNQQKNTELLAELAQCRQKQDTLQSEHEHLKAVLAGMVQHLNMLGTLLGGPKAVPSTPPCITASLAALVATNGTAASTSASGDNANNSSAASACSIQDSPSEFSTPTGGMTAGGLPPLPPVPDFPFPPGPAVQPSVATPLSLAEALSSEMTSPVVPLSLAGLCQQPAGPKIFSFTLRKADGTDLGLNVSHHEEDKVLRVESVRAEGAVEAWNRQCIGSASSDKAVLPGDRIISVNSIYNDPVKMLEACRDKQLLKLTVVRGEVLKTKTLRADASEFVPGGAGPAASVPSTEADQPSEDVEKAESSVDACDPSSEKAEEKAV